MGSLRALPSLDVLHSLTWGGISGFEEPGGVASPSEASRWLAPPRCLPQLWHPGTARSGSGSLPRPCLARIIHTVKPSPRDPPDSVVLGRINPRCWIAGEYSTGPGRGPLEIWRCGESPTPGFRGIARLTSSFPSSWMGRSGIRRRNGTANFFGPGEGVRDI